MQADHKTKIDIQAGPVQLQEPIEHHGSRACRAEPPTGCFEAGVAVVCSPSPLGTGPIFFWGQQQRLFYFLLITIFLTSDSSVSSLC